jgi:hypothetical protein
MKRSKRTAKSSSKGAGARATKRGSTKPKGLAKRKKLSSAITRSRVKGTAKKAAKAAAVAAGLAAVGTVLTELGRGEKKPSEGETKNDNQR